MPAIKYKKKTYAGSTFPVLEMTKAEYDALPEAKKMDGTVYMITDDTGGWEAEDSAYDNSQSGLTATDVQGAVDEIVNQIDVLRSKYRTGKVVANGNTYIDNLPDAYIIAVCGTQTSNLAVAIGVGYGAASIRHIVTRIGTSGGGDIQFVPSESMYRLVINNSGSTTPNWFLLSIS